MIKILLGKWQSSEFKTEDISFLHGVPSSFVSWGKKKEFFYCLKLVNDIYSVLIVVSWKDNC